MQDGLLFYEKENAILYSSDLMLRYGNGAAKSIGAAWADEIDAISEERIPNPDKLKILKGTLKKINPKFIAVGHGYCIKCKNDQHGNGGNIV